MARGKEYTIRAGSQPLTGPRDSRYSQCDGAPLSIDVVAGVLDKVGDSFFVEVTQPPSMRGRRFWIASRPGKNTGFY